MVFTSMNLVASKILDVDDTGERFMVEGGSVQPEIVIEDDTNLPTSMIAHLRQLTPISTMAPL